MTSLKVLLLAVALAATLQSRAIAQSLVADLSEDLIAITTRFTGSDVLLFGATDGEGDVIVVVRGPQSRIVIRRKSRVGGVWINRDALEFANVPSFYYLAASQPLPDILEPAVRRDEQIGLEELQVEAVDPDAADDLTAFREALIRNKQALALYYTRLGEITFVEDRLFRARVTFPANVSTGPYLVDVYQVVDGAITGKTTTPLRISRTGFEANVFDFAQVNPALYGLIAILVALVAGWVAGFIFRKV